MKIKSLVLGSALIASSILGLASCGASKEASVDNYYIGHHTITVTGTSEYNGQTITYESTTDYYENLWLLDDGTYVMNQTQAGTQMTCFVTAKGTYELKEANAKYDGYTEVVLANATYVDTETDIYGHMFSLSINSETSTFPHEIAGGSTLSKDEFLEEYGVFGSRYILHVANITDTSAQNWIDIEDDVTVVE